MPKIVFIEHNGTEHIVDAAVGGTIMQAAIDNLIPGIVGDCGGCCSCATCHGYIEAVWDERISPKSDNESMLLDGASCVRPSSRLTCQISIQPELDGIVVRLPESQY